MGEIFGVEDFLALPGVCLDVRSPSEHSHAALPNALSLPLFSDEERAQVGTCYKKVGRDPAVELGLRLAGPHFADLVHTAKEFCQGQMAKVYCWRGGMRSGAVAWLLEIGGLRTATLKGGYKSYRRRCLEILDGISAEKGPPVTVLAGMTGAAKTEILARLKAQGEQILDLEHLASHRGSSYGTIGMPPQPSTERFENAIAEAWRQLDASRRVWIEDESPQIGLVRIPSALFEVMQNAPTWMIERPKEERVDHLLKVYGKAPTESLVAATRRLAKRLGGQRTQQIVDLIESGHLREFIALALDYYDKTYAHCLKLRKRTPQVLCGSGLSLDEWACRVRSCKA